MPIICFAISIAFAGSPLSDPQYPAAMGLLAQAQIGRDPVSLIRYLRKRTPDAAKLERIAFLIRQLGEKRFVLRGRASDELNAIGAPAEKALEAALSDPDAERADRANRCLQTIRENSETSTIIAAMQILSYSASQEAVGAIFTYLPFANDPAILDAARESLLRLGMKDLKAINEIATWSSDREGIRRSIAGSLLGRSSDPHQQEIARHLLEDPDPWVRLRTAEGMLYRGHETAIPIIIASLDPGDSDRSWAAQSLLAALFGNSFPQPPSLDKAEEWTRYRSTCLEWWTQNERGIDKEKLPSRTGRVLGLVIGIEYSPGRIWACGRDGRRLWDFHAHFPVDVRWLSDDRIVVAERGPHRVYECDRSGKISWERPLPVSPLYCDRLPNGNTVIGSDSSVLEMRRDGTILYHYQYPFGGMNDNRRLPNGHFLGVTPMGDIAELNAIGKVINRVKAPPGAGYNAIAYNSRGNYIVHQGNKNQYLEIDRQGKVVATIAGQPRCCGLEVLQDGNLLLTSPGKAFVLGLDGRVRKEYKGETDGCRRAHMR